MESRKVCEKQFPKGTFVGQKSDGFHLDPTLKDNLDILVRAIAKDMQFNFLVTGHGKVRVGKSTFAQQIGTYLTTEINQTYNIKNTFTVENIVFKGEELISVAKTLPKYSVLILDEGDDLVDNYWSALSTLLRKFFRKCGQLNIFLILLLPDFFELPKPYAVTRTEFLLDVKFFDEYERGLFDFYNYTQKKMLYKDGKKYGDYDAVKPAFSGRFSPYYTVGEEAYREKKRKDLEEDKKDFENEYSSLDDFRKELNQKESEIEEAKEELIKLEKEIKDWESTHWRLRRGKKPPSAI
jgi:hypothetical protein